METQKLPNLLNRSVNKSSRFATTKCFVIHDKNGTDYGEGNINVTSIKFGTENIESSLCDYSDAYILVTGKNGVTNGVANADMAFKNCASFIKCTTF